MDASNFNHLLNLTPYELHKKLINNYVLINKGSTSLLKRDTSRDKHDIDVIRENHRFLWDESEDLNTWEKRLAKKYYDKLFKEFCICDLTYYKFNQIAMRWQTEQELISGKGQFICGQKKCTVEERLKTWEVNFGYTEKGEKKNALVKLRLCIDCSYKLNYKSKRKEIKRRKLKRLGKKGQRRSRTSSDKNSSIEKEETTIKEEEKEEENEEASTEDNSIWKGSGTGPEEPSRDEEFEEYLEHLLF